MAFVNSIRSRLTFSQWIKAIFIHPNFFIDLDSYCYDPSDAASGVELESILIGSFIKTFGFDGYVSSTTELTSANGDEFYLDEQTENQASFLLPWCILNFFGIPSRPGEDFWQIIRNFFGGWDSLRSDNYFTSGFTTEGKRFWNIMALPIKLGVILPLKIIGIPFKLALNIVKLFTEFLPELIVNYTCLANFHLAQDSEAETVAGLILNLIFRFILRVIVGIIHYAARILLMLGTAFTSPEKSARDAWEFGRSLDVPVLGFIVGALGATLSIAITTTLWMLVLPLAAHQIIVLIPQLVPVLTAISQWPVVTSCMNIAQGIYSVLPAAFSAVGSALGTAFGVSINALVLTVTVSITSIAGLATVIGSRIADKLSNNWTHWEPDMNLGEGLRAMTGLQNNDDSYDNYCFDASSNSGTHLRLFDRRGNTYNRYGGVLVVTSNNSRNHYYN